MERRIDPADLITTKAAADYLGVHPNTLKRWCDENIGPAHYLMGELRRFHPDDLDEYVQSRRKDPEATETGQ